MSKTIDERVVSMQFDNKNFESNVKTTMTTLEKLKSHLNLFGASKGLESINTAAKNCNLAPMANAVDGVRVKFSTLQVAALTCLQNITNQAFNTGKRILSSLTIDPVMSGFSEYETKMGSIQTILANTEHQGTTLDDVTAALDKLNLYADKTIYNFQQMTRNIGTFTAAGVDLDTSVKSIQGIANLAAVSGSTSQQASAAMYQLSQALSSGTVRLQDWNSVVHAGMGGKVFQNALIRTAAMLDGAASDVEAWQKKNVDSYGSFRDSLTQGAWLTTDVLTKTLEQFTMAAEEGTKEWETYKKSLMDSGYTEKQTEEILKMANTATDAATKVKTFTQLMDTLKESAQSGWAQSWEIIVGDFDESKSLWTGLSKVIGGLINKMADRRNRNLGEALNSNWEKLSEKIVDAGIETSKFEDSLKDALKASGKDVDKLIDEYGSLEKIFTSGAASSDILKAAIEALNGSVGEVGKKLFDLSGIDDLLGFGAVGDDVKKAQDALEKLGYTLEKFGVDGIIGDETTAAIRQFQADNGLKIDGIIGPETIAALEKAAEATGELTEENQGLIESYEELCDSIDKTRGRELFIESWVELFEKLQPIFDSFKQKWNEAFDDFPSIGDVISTCIDNFAEFVDNLEFSKDTLAEIDTVIQGFISTLQTLSIMGGGLWGWVVKVLKLVGSNLGMNFWDMTVVVANLITKFYQWITTNNVLYESLLDIGTAVVTFITSTIDGILNWVNAFLKLPQVTAQIEKLSTSFANMLSNISGWLNGFGTIFSEFFNTLLSMDTITADGVISAVGELISGIFGQLREIIGGLDTPFTDFIDLIITFFAELTNGEGTIDKFNENFAKIKDSVNKVLTPLGNFINKCLELGDAFGTWLASLKDAEDLPTAIGEGIGRAIGAFIVYIRDSISTLAADIWKGMTGVGEDGVAGLVNGIMNGIKTVVKSIWTIGVTMIETIMTVLDENSPSKVMMAIGAFAIIGLAMGLMQAAPEVWNAIVDFGGEMLSKFSNMIVGILDWLKQVNFGQVLSLAVTGGMLAFAVSVVKIGMRIADAVAGISEGIAGMAKGAGKILGNIGDIFGEIAKNKKAERFAIYAEGIKSLAIAIGILAASIAVLTLVADKGDMWSAVGAIAAILAAFAAFAAVMALAERFGKISALKFGAMALGMTGIAIGIAIVASAAKKLSEVPTEKLGGVVTGMVGFMLGLTTLVTLFGAFAKGKVVKNIDKLGPVLLRMGAVMLMMAFAVKMLGTLDASQVEQGRNAVVAFGLVIAGLVAVTQLAGKNLKAIGNVILKIGGVFLLMAYVMKLMSGFTPEQIDQGMEALVSFGGIILATILLMRLISLIPSKSGSKSGGGKLEGIGSTILQVAGALFIIAAAAMMLGSMKPDEIKQAGNAVLGLVAVIGVLLAGLNAINAGNLKDVGSTLLMVAGSILVIAAAAKLLGGMQWQELLAATIAIGAFGAGIYFMIQNLGKIKAKNLSGVGMTLLFAAGAIAILATIASVIGFIPIDVLAKGVGAVAIIGALIMGLIKVSEKAKDVKSTLIGISVAMAVLSAAIVAISLIAKDNPVAILESVAAIGLTMVVLAAVLNNIGKTKLNVKSLLAITGVITVLGGTLILLGRLDPWRAIEAAGALSLAMIAMSGALVLINKFGSTSGAKKGPQTLKLLGMMAVVALAISAAIAIIGKLDTGAIWHAAGAISATMLVMSLLTVMMNTLGSGGSVGSLLAMSVALLAIGASIRMMAEIPVDQLWSAFGVLALSMTVLTLAVVGLAAAFTAFAPGAGLVIGVLLSIAVVAVAVGAAAVLFAGALYIVGEALPGVAIGLTMLITSLAGCSEHAWAFIGVCAALLVGLTLVTVGLAVLSVGVVVAAAAMLVGVTLLSVGLVVLSVGLVVASVGLVVLSAGLLLAGAGVYVFAGGLMFAAAACEAVATVLPSIAEGLATLIETLAGCSDSAWKFIGVCAALAIGIVLLTIAAGVFTVGAALMSVGLIILSVGLVIVSAAVVLFSGALLIGAAAVYIMATAISFLGTCITDGLAAGVAAGIETVTAAVTGLAESVIGTICSVLGINSPSLVMQSLGQFTGQGFALGISDSEGDVSGAATDLANAAKDGLGEAGTEGGNAFNAEALSNMDVDSLLSGSNIDTSSLTGVFGTAGKESGSAFNASALENMDFESILSGDGMDMSALTGAFGDLGIESGTAFSTGASENASMKPTLDAMLEEISGSKPQFNEAGRNVLKAFGEGLTAASSSVTSKLASSVQSMASGLKNKRSSFYSAGKYLVVGFASGITANTFMAQAAAAAMARAAYMSAKKVLDINSPSKVFKALGTSVPEGFAMGIGMLGGMITDSVETMAGTAIDRTRDVISRIADVIDTDIDSQPTIRPVLDLSDVEAGAGAIGGMFGANSIGLSTIGSINTMMNRRVQNGGNGEIVSAIDKLRKDLGNVGNTSYNINGITYDRGSELDDAIRTIVRYARIEGRV